MRLMGCFLPSFSYSWRNNETSGVILHIRRKRDYSQEVQVIYATAVSDSYTLPDLLRHA